MGIEVEGVAIGVNPEGAELLGGAIGDGGAAWPTVEPEDKWRRLCRQWGLNEPVEESPAGARVDGHVAGVLGEGHVAGLAGELGDPVTLLLCR